MRISVLDHGYVEFIEAWGTGKDGLGSEVNMEPRDYEVGIIESARQSTQGSFKGWDEDKGLLRTLFHHQHNQSSPFETAGMTIEVHAPIFVFREWHRHRTQSYNEASARYKPLKPVYYVPDAGNLLERAVEVTKNKQAGTVSSSSKLTPEAAERWLELVDMTYRGLEQTYQEALRIGVPKELARITMPVGHYSTMRATANLRNWLAFLTLRLDEKAQWEIRQYAQAVEELVKENFPQTWSLFNESRS